MSLQDLAIDHLTHIVIFTRLSRRHWQLTSGRTCYSPPLYPWKPFVFYRHEYRPPTYDVVVIVLRFPRLLARLSTRTVERQCDVQGTTVIVAVYRLAISSILSSIIGNVHGLAFDERLPSPLFSEPAASSWTDRAGASGSPH